MSLETQSIPMPDSLPTTTAEVRQTPQFRLLEWLDCALFLDFDGTLVDLAATPESVVVEPGLVQALTVLHEKLDGRLAIVSGRPIAQIDAMLAPLVLPAAGVHGGERRDARGDLHYAPAPSLVTLELRAQQLVADHPALRVEHKRGALALHYRQAPELEEKCRAVMLAAVQESPGMVLIFGKMVIEAKPAGTTKGTAIRDFLAEAPFAGRRPVFAGDDTTDEAGFAYAQEVGGLGLKIGAGPSIALHRIASTDELRAELLHTADLLSKGTP